MNKEISNILDMVKSSDIDGAYKRAKILFKEKKNDLGVVKALVYVCIQKTKYQEVINVLEDFFKNRHLQKDFDYYNNLGLAYLKIEEFEKAKINLFAAHNLNPSMPNINGNLAELYIKFRNFEEADKYLNNCLSKIFDIDKKFLSQYTNIFLLKIQVAAALGENQKIINLFREILQLTFNEDIFYLLATVDPNCISNELLKTAEQKINENNLKFNNKLSRFYYIVPLYFALGLYYNNRDKNISENYFHLANKETFNNIRYDSFSYQKKILKLIDFYEKNELDQIPNFSKQGKNNIFIVGSPRSGTTLLESIVAANDDVFSAGELISVGDIISTNLDNFENDIGAFQKNFCDTYARRVDYLRGDYQFCTDKLPENFLYMGHLLNFLPEAKIIRIFRHPWDTAISLYKQRYLMNIPFSASFFNIGVFMANFEAINLYWNKKIQNKSNILDIRYEELVSEKEDSQKKIYSFLKFTSEYQEKKREEFFSSTASIQQVQGAIYKSSIGKKEFEDRKSEFYDSINMQRDFWVSKGIIEKQEDFFGYVLD